MSVAALTSTISMLEIPVAYVVESHNMQRTRATVLIGAGIFLASAIIIFNFDVLFGLVIIISTQYSEPLVGLTMCVFAGWVLQRNSLLKELKKGDENAERGLFWKIWPGYVRIVCPAAILTIFLQKFLS
jgi:NSS family neurotransmitter:Na+ symporter